MIIVGYVRDFVFGAIATLFFSYVIHSPKKIMFITPLIGSSAYLVSRLFYIGLGKELLGYFAGSLLISVFGEIFARIYKIPANVFIFPSILLLVPGTGLYRSMLYLVQGNYDSFLSTGVRTLFISGILALGIAIANLAARKISFSKMLSKCKSGL